MKKYSRFIINADFEGGIYNMNAIPDDEKTEVKRYSVPISGFDYLNGDFSRSFHPDFINYRKNQIIKEYGFKKQTVDMMDTALYAAIKRFDEIIPATDYLEEYISLFRRYDACENPEIEREKIKKEIKSYLDSKGIIINYNASLNNMHDSISFLDRIRGIKTVKNQEKWLGIISGIDRELATENNIDDNVINQEVDHSVESSEFSQYVEKSREKKKKNRYQRRQEKSKEYLANNREKREKRRAKARVSYENCQQRLREKELEKRKQDRIRNILTINGLIPSLYNGLKNIFKLKKENNKKKSNSFHFIKNYTRDKKSNTKKNIIRGAAVTASVMMLFTSAGAVNTNIEHEDFKTTTGIETSIKNKSYDFSKEKVNFDEEKRDDSNVKIAINEDIDNSNVDIVKNDDDKSFLDYSIGSEINGLSGKYYETPEGTGNFGSFENHNGHDGKVISIIDLKTPNGLKVYTNTSKSMRELRKELAESEGISEDEIDFSVHFVEGKQIIDSNGNTSYIQTGHTLGWVEVDSNGKPNLIINSKEQRSVER